MAGASSGRVSGFWRLFTESEGIGFSVSFIVLFLACLLTAFAFPFFFFMLFPHPIFSNMSHDHHCVSYIYIYIYNNFLCGVFFVFFFLHDGPRENLVDWLGDKKGRK